MLIMSYTLLSKTLLLTNQIETGVVFCFDRLRLINTINPTNIITIQHNEIAHNATIIR